MRRPGDGLEAESEIRMSQKPIDTQRGTATQSGTRCRRWRKAAGAAVMTLAIALALAPNASAALEQVGNFGGLVTPSSEAGVFPEYAQLGGLSGLAVNRDGAGGVPAGTVYAADYPGQVARYSSDGTFELAWKIGSGATCGPKAVPPSACTPHVEANPQAVDVEVDQQTGNVYTFLSSSTAGDNQIVVWPPSGGKILGEFGPRAAAGTKSSENPEQIHGSSTYPQTIAINEAAEVFVAEFNETGPSPEYRRLLRFKEQIPGDPDSYSYVVGGDIATGSQVAQPVTAENGHIFTDGNFDIYEWDPSQPNAPICHYRNSKGGIAALTADPKSGGVFYYSNVEKALHELSPCDPSTGTFTDLGVISYSPKKTHLSALTFNPSGSWSEKVGETKIDRSPGILYAGAPNPVLSGNETALGYIFAPQLSPLPVIESESVSEVTSDGATLLATVTPRKGGSYRFEYETQIAFESNPPGEEFAGAASAPLGGAPLAAGSDPVEVSQRITGLQPGTTYRFRLVAEGTEGEVIGTSSTLTTFVEESAGLPDDRAYELVSPSLKNGGQVFPADSLRASCSACGSPGQLVVSPPFPTESSRTGDAVAYEGTPFSHLGGPDALDEYISRRTPSGWTTEGLGPRIDGDPGGGGFAVYGISETFEDAAVFASNLDLAPAVGEGYGNIFRQKTADTSNLVPALEAAPEKSNQSFFIKYAGASRDQSLIAFASNEALTGETSVAPEAPQVGNSENNLYAWGPEGIALVNVLPGNSTASPGATFGSKNVAQINYSHAVSGDGQRIFWSSASGQVYVRVNGEETIEIPDHAGRFLTASADGSKVLLTNGRIYDLEAEAFEELSEDESGQVLGGFLGMVGQSSDLSSVYFVDTAVLSQDPNQEGASAEAGEANLYGWHSGEAEFIGVLNSSPGDNSDQFTWAEEVGIRLGQASPSGRWLAFQSHNELTAAGTEGRCLRNPHTESSEGPVPCNAVYAYDSVSGQLKCASCNPTGSEPLGPSYLTQIRHGGSAPPYLPQVRYMTDNGRLFFDSGDKLSVADANGSYEDVYQFEPESVGSCTRPGGCVQLVSSGQAGTDSRYLGTDEAGVNAFFTTRQRLLAADKDDLVDLYDARIGGGFPTAPAQTECSGEACQAPPSPVGESSPGSTTVPGVTPIKKKSHPKKHKKKPYKHHKKQKKTRNQHGAKKGGHR